MLNTPISFIMQYIDEKWTAGADSYGFLMHSLKTVVWLLNVLVRVQSRRSPHQIIVYITKLTQF